MTTASMTTATIPTAAETAISASIRHDYDLRIPYYCEENVWRLAYRKLYYQDQMKQPTNEGRNNNDDNKNETYYVAFISNQQKCVPMYHQRAATAPSTSSTLQRKEEIPCCFWDYHVILLGVTLAPTNGGDDIGDMYQKTVLVYDIDTTIVPYPVPLHRYLSQSFPMEKFSSRNTGTNSPYLQYKPYFRIVPAETYIHHFTSDRSHMFNETTQTYNEPPPPYCCIVASHSTDDTTIPTNSISKSAASTTGDGEIGTDTSTTRSIHAQSNFKKYIDFTTKYNEENYGSSSANQYGIIITLEQLIHHDF